MAAATQKISVLVALRELYNGDWYGFPVIAPDQVSYGQTRADVVSELELFLGKQLARIRADKVGQYGVSPTARLVEVDVPISRDDLPRRMKDEFAVRMPCVVVEDTWVIILPLAHTTYVPRPGELESAIVREAQRHVAASELPPEQLEQLFAGRSEEIMELAVELEPYAGVKEGRNQKELTRAMKRKAAVELLREVGTEVSGEQDGPPPELVGRQQARDSLTALLEGEQRLGALVVGPEACGKSTVIEHVLSGRKRVYSTSGAQLIAGQSFFGQWQQRVHDVMEAAEFVDAVLWFDDLSDVFASRDGSAGIASVMRSYLEERRVRVVGELRPADLERVESRNFGFFQNLHHVRVEPLDLEQTERVLAARQDAARREDEAAPRFTADAITRIVELIDRYEPYRAFPGKAVAFFDELSASQADELAKYVQDQDEPVVEERNVLTAYSASSGVPRFLLRQDVPLRLERVESFFRERIVGQRAAINRVAEAVCTVKASLQPDTKPLANLLFIGPTGVGKTEVARTLARFLFGSEERMIRFDMSEYMAADAAQRLIRGTQRDDGLLTRAIRNQPFSVVLLDEIEKAHPSVFDLLLQVLGEGRLSDARGRTAYFHNALIIMTSNLGAAHRRANVGFGETESDGESYYVEKVEDHFRPEFVNRLDRIVGFEALAPEEIREVANIALQQLRQRRGLCERGVSLEVTDQALEAIAKAGYSEAYGARQLKRQLEDDLAGPIAAMVSEAGAQARQATLYVSVEEEDVPASLGERRELASRSGERLEIRMFAGSGSGQSLRIEDLDSLSELRRTLRQLRHSRRIEQLDDRVGFLSSQLDMGEKRQRRLSEDPAYAAEVGRMASEREKLREVLGELDAALSAIEETEELAVGAVIEGDPAGELLGHVEDLAADFYVALAHALLATEDHTDRITMELVECDPHGALDLWLPSLLDAAEQRGWRVSGHPKPASDEERKGWGDGWPRGADVGPEMSTEELRSWLSSVAPPRSLVLCVVGGWSGGLLACEAGVFEFVSPPGRDDDALLEVRTASFEHGPRRLVESPIYRVHPPMSGVALKNAERSRVYDFGKTRLTVRDTEQVRIDWYEYFGMLERVVCWDLGRFDDDYSVEGSSLFVPRFDPELADAVEDSLRAGKKVEAIKRYRNLTGLGLKEAKDAVEAMMEAL
jgi:ATP-dependent Clp protease ATP-binding subunit ClpC